MRSAVDLRGVWFCVKLALAQVHYYGRAGTNFKTTQCLLTMVIGLDGINAIAIIQQQRFHCLAIGPVHICEMYSRRGQAFF